MINVLIAEDDLDVRTSLASTLESDPEICVVGEACDGFSVVKLAMSLLPDIILMDIRMPGIDGLEAAKIIRALSTAKKKEMRVLLLSTFYDDDYVQKSRECGVYGYLLKGQTISKLANAIKSVASDLMTFDRTIYENQNTPAHYGTNQKSQLDLLSSNEIIILKLIVSGKKNSEIADELYLSGGTVRNYVSSMLSKLDCKSSRELASLGTKAGL
ncbi:MAG: response regulator transcription factor [Clostridiales bacterium]|nr:response regulator transcription factor [Clostridiales bacterium]